MTADNITLVSPLVKCPGFIDLMRSKTSGKIGFVDVWSDL